MPNFVHVKANDSNPAASVGVQSWSRGDIFPAVISVVEEYDSPVSYAGWLALNSQVAHASYAPALYKFYLIEFYARPLAERIIARRYVLSLAGWRDAVYASYDEARAEAIERLAYVDEENKDAAYRYARRTYFSYTPEQIAAGEMAGGSPVSTEHYQH